MSIDEELAALASPSLPGIALGLERMEQLLAALGSPHKKLPPVIHIAGTNGKGSTAAFLRACAEAAGLRTHLYTSPHLVRFNERIIIGGKEVDDNSLHLALTEVKKYLPQYQATFFEATTAMAFMLFAQSKSDLLILETGMGGRLDATNVVTKPLATIITPIALDHQEYLGDNLAAIAAEKAGIIKPETPCIVAAQKPEAMAVISTKAQQLAATIFCYGHEWRVNDGYYVSSNMQVPLSNLALFGPHQPYNAALAIAAIEAAKLPVTTASMETGLASAHHPARMQRLPDILGANIEIYLDGGHNPHAAAALAEIAASWHDKPLYMITGMMGDKDIKGFLSPFRNHVTHLYAVTVPGETRSATADEIAAIASSLGIPASPVADLKQAMKSCPSDRPARLLIAGSLYLAGKILAEISG